MTDIETFREQQLTRLRDAGALAAFEGAPPELLAALKRVVGASDFVREALEREAGLGKWLIEEAELGLALDATAMARRIEAAAATAGDHEAFMAALRRQRGREMVRIAWRDLAGIASVSEALAETSAFADASIEAAVASPRASSKAFTAPRATRQASRSR